MRKVLLISPHLDDAVLSAGQFLAGRPDADVVTVFAGTPKDEQQTDYDIKCGFTNSTDAMSVRCSEDVEALALLQATAIHWNILDSQYLDPMLDDREDRISRKILSQLAKEDYEFILAPLGLGHPDHIFLANIVRSVQLSGDIKIPIYYWEDLPIRVTEPELVQPRLDHLKLTRLIGIGDGPIADKIRSLTCYRSQIGTGILNPYIMYVPERFWQ